MKQMWLSWVIWAVLPCAFGCGGGDDQGPASNQYACPVGYESCPCTQGGGCDPGLICYEKICEVGSGGSAGSGGTGGTGATGGGAGTTASTGGTGGSGAAAGTGGANGVTEQDLLVAGGCIRKEAADSQCQNTLGKRAFACATTPDPTGEICQDMNGSDVGGLSCCQ